MHCVTAGAIFCRGKCFGHDVDLLLSHADKKVTDILLDTLVDHLKREISYIAIGYSGKIIVQILVNVNY